MKANDIFTPGKLPTWTYVDDHLKDKKQDLLYALSSATLVSISGPSKSGKTVFVEHVIGKDDLIQVTGASIRSPEELWIKIFQHIGTSIPRTTTSGKIKSGSLSLKGASEGNLLVAKLAGEISGSGTYTAQNTESHELAIDYLQLLIQQVANSDSVIFIDDFHYIPRDIQSELAKQMKEAIRQGVKFICASVPYHSDDVIRSNPDLRGRIFSIDFEYWNPDILKKIAYKGFQKAKIDIDEIMVNFLANESAGSPQLMQSLCLSTCNEINVRNEIPRKLVRLNFDIEQSKRICRRTVQTVNYSSIVEKLFEGPKPRGADRKMFASKIGWQGDVYTFLLKALSLDPPQLTFRYQQLVHRITHLCDESAPSGSSITSACSHISRIANDSAGDKIVEWDTDNDVFDIRDPYLLFYLRWSDRD